MDKLKASRGFTLVELAIVLTIVGILTGGALEGHEILQTARINGTISQIKGIQTAITTFKDIYGGLPGDIPQPNLRVPNYPIDGTALPTTTQDGYIGAQLWGAGGFKAQLPAAGMNPAAMTIGGETQLFWTQMLLAGLITGITDQPVHAQTLPQWDVTHPAAKIGGGFNIGHNYFTSSPSPGSTVAPPGSPFTNLGLSGTVLVITQLPNADLQSTTGNLPMTPERAAHLDRKMDDGRPGTGIMQAYGVTASCFQTLAINSYDESVGANDCGVLVRAN